MKRSWPLFLFCLGAAPPVVPPVAAWKAPVPAVSTLPNGLSVVSLLRDDLPLVSITVAVRAGAELDPPERTGLAAAVAMMLEDGGAGDKNASELARAFDNLGGELDVSADRSGVEATITVVEPQLERAMQLLAELIVRPRFDEKEWPAAKERRSAEIVRLLDEPRYVASAAFDRAVYGQHPYGAPVLGTLESVSAIGAGELRVFHAAHFSPKSTAVILVGAVTPERAAKLTTAAFGSWKTNAGAVKPAALSARGMRRVILIDRPGAPQTEIRIGHLGVPRSTPDLAALMVLETVLGGSFTSRLMQNLREKHGYTYGAVSSFDLLRSAGKFSIRAAVRTDVTAPAVRESMNELELIAARPLSAEELNKGRSLVKSYWVESFSARETIAAVFAELWLLERPLDEPARLSAALDALTPETALAAAQRLFAPGEATILLVGDRKTIEGPVQALGLAAKVELARPAGAGAASSSF